MRFEKKLGHTNFNPEGIYLYNMDLICKDWKHILRNGSTQKSFFKTFCYNKQDTWKMVDFQKLSNKEIYFTLQSNSSNTPNRFSLFHSQTLWKVTKF